MKKWTIGLLTATLLLSTAACGKTASAVLPASPTAPPSPEAPAVSLLKTETTQSAPKAAGTLTISLEHCNNLRIQETAGGKLGLDDPQGNCKSKIGKPSNGVTVMEVTGPEDESKPKTAEPVVLTIPKGTYATVVIDADESGVTVQPSAADYRITADECAVSVSIPQGYSGKVDLLAEECAASVNFVGQMQNTAFTLKYKESSFSLPKGWTVDKPTQSLSFTRGTGAAKINLSMQECSFSVVEGGTGLNSKYEKSDKDFTGIIDIDSGLVLQTGKKDAQFTWGQSTEQRKALEKENTPNTVAPIKTIPAAGITGLQIQASLCGMAVEPSKSGQFEISYIGVKDTKRYTVATAVENGVLTVTAEGAADQIHYIQTEPGKRVNTVLVGVPANVLKGLTLDNNGSILVSGLDLPIRAIALGGLIRIQGDSLTQPIYGEAEKGYIAVEGKTISGEVELSAEKGTVSLKATTVTGDVDLSAESGAVKLEAEHLREADLSAENGSITAVVGVIGKELSAEAENGSIKLQLTQAPKDLTFRLETEKGFNGKKSSLPIGWYNGYKVGTGVPELKIEIGNGVYQVKVGK